MVFRGAFPVLASRFSCAIVVSSEGVCYGFSLCLKMSFF
jgi:hypothetical protein